MPNGTVQIPGDEEHSVSPEPTRETGMVRLTRLRPPARLAGRVPRAALSQRASEAGLVRILQRHGGSGRRAE